MNPDVHIYIVTAVVALVMATAISVFAPRNPLASSLVVPEASVASNAGPQAQRKVVEGSPAAPATPQRVDASL